MVYLLAHEVVAGTLGRFLAEEFTEREGTRCSFKDIYNRYCEWAARHKYERLSKISLGKYLASQGFLCTRDTAGKARVVNYYGLSLNSESIAASTLPAGTGRRSFVWRGRFKAVRRVRAA